MGFSLKKSGLKTFPMLLIIESPNGVLTESFLVLFNIVVHARCCQMQCAFLFSLISLFSSLFQVPEEESGKPFQCPICGLVIKRKSYWKRHMVIHTGLKSHQCPLCPFRCARKDNLKSHMKVSCLWMGMVEQVQR